MPNFIPHIIIHTKLYYCMGVKRNFILNNVIRIRNIIQRIPFLEDSYHLSIQLRFIISYKLEIAFIAVINLDTKEIPDSCNNLFNHRLDFYLR